MDSGVFRFRGFWGPEPVSKRTCCVYTRLHLVDVSRTLTANHQIRDGPKHDHDHFRVHLAEPNFFQFGGTPGYNNKSPPTQWNTQREKQNDFSSDAERVTCRFDVRCLMMEAFFDPSELEITDFNGS